MLDNGQSEWPIPVHGRYGHEQRRRLLPRQSPAPGSGPGVLAWRTAQFHGAVTSSAPSETTDFEFSFNSTGQFLFVIDHESNAAAGAFPQGNALHILAVASDGTLSESPNSPVFLPANIPSGADPQGVAVIAASDFDDFGTGIGKKTYSVDFGFGDIDNPFAPFVS